MSRMYLKLPATKSAHQRAINHQDKMTGDGREGKMSTRMMENINQAHRRAKSTLRAQRMTIGPHEGAGEKRVHMRTRQKHHGPEQTAMVFLVDML